MLASWRAPASSRKKRIGIFTTGPRSPDNRREWEGGLGRALAEFGFKPGSDLEFVWFDSVRPADDYDRAAPPVAEKIARAGLDCVITFGSPFTQHLQRATRTLPIVTYVGDPVAAGFARTLSRPGGNITGLHQGHAETSLKQVELMRALLPGITSVGWIGTRPQLTWLPTFENAAKAAGLAVHTVVFESAFSGSAVQNANLDRLKAELSQWRSAGCLGAHFYGAQRSLVEPVATLALQHRIGIACSGAEDEDLEREGILFNYGPEEWSEQRGRRQATLVARILRGERPADIPFEGPRTYRFTLNLNTARRLGISVPQHVLVLADRTIGAR